jgi:hypothetical protein
MRASPKTAGLTLLWILVTVGAAGCATTNERINFTPPPGRPEPRTVQIFASSSIKHRPVKESPSLRDHIAVAFQHRFPNIELEESKPDMVVFFTIVDYVPGCSPNCGKFRTYRNWSCEVELFPRESGPQTDTLVFNFEGSTFNPFYDSAANCAARFAKIIRQ